MLTHDGLRETEHELYSSVLLTTQARDNCARLIEVGEECSFTYYVTRGQFFDATVLSRDNSSVNFIL